MTEIQEVLNNPPRVVCFVAGLQFTKAKEFLDNIKAQDAVTLTPEPENQYDPKAVRVDWDSRKLGYIPRTHNSAVFDTLVEGPNKLRAIVNKVDPAAKSHMSVELAIYECLKP